MTNASRAVNLAALSEEICSAIHHLCLEIPNRRMGSAGNRQATDYAARRLKELGFQVATPQFTCLDWEGGPVELTAGSRRFSAQVSPYSLPCTVTAPLVQASTWEELLNVPASGCLLLLRGALAAEQAIPKNYPFYIPVEHPDLLLQMEQRHPAAILAATERNPELAGGVYPFPLIEDGDFDIPSVFMTAEEGQALSAHLGEPVSLSFTARRIPSHGCNVTARLGAGGAPRLVFCAHIDAKRGTPGALDNAAGVSTLLALAGLLAASPPTLPVEFVMLNGEDDYSAAGQALYLKTNEAAMDEILVAFNIDAAGYREGGSVVSAFDLPPAGQALLDEIMGRRYGVRQTAPWYASDHMIFVSKGRPAVAFTSAQFLELTTHITHTARDLPELVDCADLARVALGLSELARQWPAA